MPLNYHNSQDIMMQLFMTKGNGLGVKAFFKNPHAKKQLEESKQQWVKVGYFDLEDPKSMPSMPISTPLYNNRKVDGLFVKPHLDAKAGDTGHHLAVFANHTSFIPNAVILKEPNNQTISLFATLKSCLNEQELLWSYTMADTEITSYHRIFSSWHPSKNDIHTLQDASLWRQLSSLLSNLPSCDLTRIYITVVVRNIKQYTWMGLYIEQGIFNNTTVCKDAKIFYNACLEYNNFVSPVANFNTIDKKTKLSCMDKELHVAPHVSTHAYPCKSTSRPYFSCRKRKY